MTASLILVVYATAAMIIALMAGVFLAFSDFLIRSLKSAGPIAGLCAMQSINREVFRSLFLYCFLAMTPVSVLLAGYAFFYVDGPARNWFVAGSTVYLLGTFAVTIFGNVPMNEKLDKMEPGQKNTQAYWSNYTTFWTVWNHIRTIASTLSAICFLVGCMLFVPP